MCFKGLVTGRLPREVYISGLENFIISTVDFVLRRGLQFFLIKRKGGAFSGEWFVAGGRQNRGEEELTALHRIAKRELGVNEKDVVTVRFSHCQDVCNPASKNDEGSLPEWHSKWHFYVVEVTPDFKLKLDETSSEGQWFTELPVEGVPEPVIRALRKSGMI
ncbi:MAG: NUDIX hydrolase [Candidatus Paceibacterota bacterium]